MDRVKQILNRLLEFWNKYTRKQKALIISTVGVVVVALIILLMVVQKPKYITLTQCNSYSELSEVTTLLASSNYEYEVDDATFVVRVKEEELTNAKMTLATANIKSAGYSIQDAMDVGFSATETDKNRYYQAYLEQKFADDLSSINGIKSASVTVVLPENSNVFVSVKNEASVSAILSLNSQIDEDTATGIAKLLATNVGNSSTRNITIVSTTGETLYSGADEADSIVTGTVSANQQEKFRAGIENGMRSSIKNGLLDLGVYDDVNIALHLDYDFDAVTKVLTEYSVPENMEQGYFTETYRENSTGGTGASGVPGTSSNDSDQSYVLRDGNGDYNTYSVEKLAYALNVLVTTTSSSGKSVLYDTSSMAVTFVKNVIYKEEEAETLGYTNEETTWEQFKAQNAEPVAMTVDDNWVQYLSFATGIDAGNISVMAYEKHYFEDIPESASGQSISFWIQLALAAVILGLLIFVVIRSAKPLTIEEVEPELSVEDMLATTKENQQPKVEDIDLQNKSETRRAIEKFVDENPEAVALLLRNWLNEGWD